MDEVEKNKKIKEAGDYFNGLVKHAFFGSWWTRFKLWWYGIDIDAELKKESTVTLQNKIIMKKSMNVFKNALNKITKKNKNFIITKCKRFDLVELLDEKGENHGRNERRTG